MRDRYLSKLGMILILLDVIVYLCQIDFSKYLIPENRPPGFLNYLSVCRFYIIMRNSTPAQRLQRPVKTLPCAHASFRIVRRKFRFYCVVRLSVCVCRSSIIGRSRYSLFTGNIRTIRGVVVAGWFALGELIRLLFASSVNLIHGILVWGHDYGWEW